MNEHPTHQDALVKAIESDLTWVLNAPSLLKGNDLLFEPTDLPKTLKLDSPTEQEVSIFMAARSGKLGRYFEFLVGLIFHYSDHYEILAQNLIIHSPERTLGEIDLLIKDSRNNDIIHMELALKFYLFVPELNFEHGLCLLGAGCHDFFKTKVNRLFNHQIKLAEVAQKAHCWPSHLPLPTHHKVWLTGRFYLPPNMKISQISSAKFNIRNLTINPDAQWSNWCEEPIDSSDDFIEKAAWISGHSFLAPKHSSPAQIWPKDRAEPLFVLPTHWQNDATAAINKYWKS